MKRVTKRFALCLDNRGNEASLIQGKVYRILPDVHAAKDELIRVVDESGEDYLYPADWFVAVEVPKAVQASLLKAS